MFHPLSEEKRPKLMTKDDEHKATLFQLLIFTRISRLALQIVQVLCAAVWRLSPIKLVLPHQGNGAELSICGSQR